MKVIGLTGGIGAGKSTVTEYLRRQGYPVFDADQIAKDLLAPGTETLAEIVSIFGTQILQNDGSLDRKQLAQIVFSDAEKKAILDRVTHGKVKEEIQHQIDAQEEGSLAFLDAPLLFEAGLETMTYENWVVDADDDLRIARVMQRDPLTESEIRNRINNQMNRKERLQRADFVLNNSLDKEFLYEQVNQLLKRLQEMES